MIKAEGLQSTSSDSEPFKASKELRRLVFGHTGQLFSAGLQIRRWSPLGLEACAPR